MKNKIILIILLAFSGQLFAQGDNPAEDTPIPTEIPDGVEVPTLPNPDPETFPNPADIEKDTFEDSIIKNTTDSVKVALPPLGLFGHDYLRRSDFKLYDKANKVKIDDSYVLGPGDNLTVSIWNQEDVKNVNYTISSDGYVELGSVMDPMTGEAIEKGIGRIYLSGVPFGKAKRMLMSKYRGSHIFNDEDFDVSLSGAKNINVDIVGQVVRPGPYKIPAINTVYNVIKLSGGPTRNGTVRNIQVKRNGKTIQTLDVYKYLLDGETRQNIYLQDNDVIFVPQIGNVVEIEGAVVRSKKFELKPNENFSNLIEYAGGFKPEAETKTLELYRFENDEYVLKSIPYDRNNSSTFTEQLQDGDFLKVDAIPRELLANKFVQIEGAINEAGRYEFKQGMRVSDLIDRANGLRFDAVTSRAYIIRLNEELRRVNIPIQLDKIIANKNSEDNIIIYPQDKLKVLSHSQFAEEFDVQLFGAVKSPGRYTFGADLTLQDLLIMSGGFKTQALTNEIEVRRVIGYNDEENRLEPIRDVVKTLKVDYNYLNPNNPDNNFKIMPMDQIFVRTVAEYERPKTVIVRGQVKYPGFYPLMSKDMRISDLIKNAGGLNPYAYKPGAKLYRKTDSVVVRKDTTMVDGLIQINTHNENVKTSKLHLLDLEEVMRRESSKYNYVLKPGDVLKIPTIDETISIAGAIQSRVEDMNIVHTAYRGNKNAKWYINEFGSGYDKDAWKRTTQVVYPNGHSKGTQKFLFFNIYPEVEPGSDIIVDYKPPKENKQNKSDFFKGLTAEKALALFSSVGGVVGLILAAKK